MIGRQPTVRALLGEMAQCTVLHPAQQKPRSEPYDLRSRRRHRAEIPKKCPNVINQ